MTIFEKNIKALSQKNPILAASIFGIQKTKFDIYQHNNDNADLNFIDKKNQLPLYQTTPLEEINNSYNIFNTKYKLYPVLFFYGIGNGVLIKLLLNNPVRKKIVVIEPDIEILFLVFNFIDFSEDIENEKLILLSSEEFNYPNAINIMTHHDILLFLKTYELQINTIYYEKLYSQDIIRVNQIFIRAIKQAIINFGNDQIDTLVGIEHSIYNMPIMLKNPPIQTLKNKKNSDIAIIISTGPSLTKQLPLLKEIENYATLISIDASMPILEKYNITPDFVVSLERVKETATFFKNTSKEFQEKFITIHASLQHKDVLKNSYGKKILSMRGFSYNRYFEIDEYGYLGIGMSAANMAYELAYLLGFKTIVLVGQDLAYSEDGLSHAPEHPYKETFKETDLYVEKYGGGGVVRTSKIWNMFKNFFEKDIAALNEKNIKTIYATEGGARIEGSIEIPFKEVIEKYIDKSRKKEKIKIEFKFDKEKYEKISKKVKKKIKKMIKEGERVKKEVENLFLEVADEFENLVYLNQNNQLEKIDFKYLKELSNKIDDIKLKIEDKEFLQMYGETISSYLINKEIDLAQIQVKYASTDIEKKAKLIDWIMNHKEWLFMLAGSINAQLIVVKRAFEEVKKELK